MRLPIRLSPLLLQAVLACVLRTSPASGQGVGPEFRVNTYTTDRQRSARLATDAGGNFVVVWMSRYQDGSVEGVFGQRYGSAGVPLGAEFPVNTYTTSNQRFPSVASDPAGNFVVCWQSYTQDGSSEGVFGQRYDSSGAPLGVEFQVSTYTTNSQSSSTVASNPDGGFVVIWQSSTQDGSVDGIFGQRYGSTGAPLGTEFQVNTYTTNRQNTPSVASDSGGSFVVVWTSLSQDGSAYGIFGQRYDNAGAPLGTEFRVNTFTANNQSSPSVTSNSGGNFVVVWQSQFQDGSGVGVFGQRYSAGAPVGGEFLVNTYTTYVQGLPSVVSDSDGSFVVVWQSSIQDGAVDGIFGQRFGSAGAPLGPEFRVNTYTTSNQRSPSLASDSAGHFVVWQSYTQDGSLEGVFAQRFCPPLSSVTISVSGTTTVCANSTGSTATVTDVGGGFRMHQWGYRTTSMTGMISPLGGQTGSSYLISGADFGMPPGTPGIYFLVCATIPECGSFLISNEVLVTVNSSDSTPPVVTPPSALTTTQTLCM